MTPVTQFINNCHQSSGQSIFTTRNPADQTQTVGQYLAADQHDIQQAIEGAQSAFEAWRDLPVFERYTILRAFHQALSARQEQLAEAVTREQGKPMGEARGEVKKSLQEAEFSFSQTLQNSGAACAGARPGFRNMVVRRPRGVIAAVTPWNFPVLTPMRKIAPALAYGNTIVIKPSEFTPAAVQIIGLAAKETLPPGVLQIINGGSEAASVLCRSALVKGITFTGSVATGKKIFSAAADSLAALSLELGGKNAAIIHDADNLKEVCKMIMGAALQCAGQRCTAISRVIVREPLLKETLEHLQAISRALKIGDGMAPDTEIGPITNASQLEKIEGIVDRAGKLPHVELICGGRRARVTDRPHGLFYEPTVISGLHLHDEAISQEIFGPVVTVMSYKEMQEALSLANALPFGLTSAVFTNDFSVARFFMERLNTGMIHINHGTIPDSHMPFGGINDSGVGAYSVGESAINFYTTEHTIYLPSGRV
jgi:alpha-ketoglutaric semialdehyde dehydrogenase